MRIAYLVNQYPQPSHSFIRREIRALESQGASVSRFTLRGASTNLVDREDIAERARTRVVQHEGVARLALALFRSLMRSPGRLGRASVLAARMGYRSRRGLLAHFAYLVEACLLVEWIGNSGAEHLHAHFGTNSAAVAVLIRVLGGPPYSLTIHGPEEFDQPEGLALGDKVARSAFTVAISEFGRSQLYRWCSPADWERIHVVRCGVDESFLSASPTPPPALPKLVSVARLSPEKGQLVLVDAIARVVDRGLEVSLSLVGDGPLRRDLERAIEARGLVGIVDLVGWKDGEGVRNAITGARALVVPSFAEGLPVVAMEALALGRPVLATHIAGIPELVVPDRNGWLVPAGSSTDLAEAIAAVLRASPAELEALGKEGARMVRERHDARAEAFRLLSLMTGARG